MSQLINYWLAKSSWVQLYSVWDRLPTIRTSIGHWCNLIHHVLLDSVSLFVKVSFIHPVWEYPCFTKILLAMFQTWEDCANNVILLLGQAGDPQRQLQPWWLCLQVRRKHSKSMFPNISHFFGHVMSKSELFLLQPVRLPAILQVKPPELFQILDDILENMSDCVI